MDLNTYIPLEIIVGYKCKKDENSTVFLTYKKPDGTYKNHQAFDNWRSRLIALDTFDNTPIMGFKILDYVGGLGRDSRMVKVQVHDPRGFVIECKLDNVLDLLKQYGYSPLNGFNTSLCYSWHDTYGLTLCPMTIDEFNNHQTNIQGVKKFALKELTPYKYYKSRNNSYTGYYLGQFKVPFLAIDSEKKFVDNHTNVCQAKMLYHNHHVFLYQSQYSKAWNFNIFKAVDLEFVEDTPETPMTTDELDSKVAVFLKKNVTYQGVPVTNNCKEFTEFVIPQIFGNEQKLGPLNFISPDNRIIMKWTAHYDQKYLLCAVYEIIDNTLYIRTSYNDYATKKLSLEDLLEQYKDYTKFQFSDILDSGLYLKGIDNILYRVTNLVN